MQRKQNIPVEQLQKHGIHFQGFDSARGLQLHFHIYSTTKIHNMFKEEE